MPTSSASTLTEMFCSTCEDSFYAFPGEEIHDACGTEGVALDGDDDLYDEDEDSHIVYL